MNTTSNNPGDPSQAPLSRLEFWGLIVFLLTVIGFGVLVEVRSAFLDRRMGDLDCFLRGAWAVRTGNDLYEVRSDNGWHYNYPPLLAILLMPLADPPKRVEATGFVPYSVSVAIWYLLNLGLTFWAVHHLSNALQERSQDPNMRHQRIRSRRWWAMRLWPFFVCLIPIGHSLMRGQANMPVLALFCVAIAAWLRQQSFRSGVAIAFATCFKVFPIFLIVYPLWKRDWRCLSGAAVGLVLGLFILPLPFFGFDGTVKLYQKFAQTTLAPALHVGDDTSRENELLGAGGTTDNQTLKVAIHNFLHLGKEGKPPAKIAPWLEWTYRVSGVLMTLATLLVRRGRGTFGMSDALQVTGLMTLMLVLCPMCHLHYFVFLMPPVMVVMVHRWEGQNSLWLGWRWHLLFSAFMVAVLLPNLPQLGGIRNLGIPTWVILVLWGAALVNSYRVSQAPQGESNPVTSRQAA